jgi:hypothetical protein
MDKIVSKNKTESSSAIWARLNFVFDNQKDSSSYFLITEGQEANYYKHQLQDVPADFVAVNAHGRENIIELFPRWRTEKKSFDRMLFFLDKEYPNKSFNNERVFVTAGHSIENYYVSKDFFKRILNEYSDFKDEDECLARVVKVYKKNWENFVDKEWRKGVLADVLQSENCEPSISKPIIGFDKIVSFDTKNLEMKWLVDDSFSELIKIFIHEERWRRTPVEIRAKLEVKFNMEIQSSSEIKGDFIRGKEALKFFVAHLTAVKQASQNGEFKEGTASRYPMQNFPDISGEQIVRMWYKHADGDPRVENYFYRVTDVALKSRAD